ncbi:2-hydroxyacid dehydrogenase [Heyndrickxia sp. FSL W8-0423]|uniref:2-hydroxyacid dehydrogenase n=1 Tax=Heyndrickxia sp. FSL W8-0423 TaxID=2921601 RepID=UPI0030FA8077
MMKIIGIGDLLIPENYIYEGFKIFEEDNCEVKTIQWKNESHEDLQNINLLVETKGSEAYEVPDYILDFIKDADILITQFCPINKKVIDCCENLKAIGVLRAGYENINVDYAKEKEVVAFNTPGRNANAVADFAVGLLLSECRNIAKSHLNMKKGHWIRDYANYESVPDLSGKTVGIVGYGEIGRKVAQRLKGFEMNIIAYDPYFSGQDEIAQLVSLEELMQQSDFVSLHTRLTKETEKMINRDLISLMKPTAYLINTARSGLIDEDALYQALKDKKIIGAALDVFDKEPTGEDYPLVTLDNVTVTPHLSGGTIDAFTNSPKLLAKEMRKLFTGELSRNVVTKELFLKKFANKNEG